METEKTKILFHVSAEDFKKIPGSPIAYWCKGAIRAFESNKTIDSNALIRSGLSTGDNDRFMRLWHEVSQNIIAFDFDNDEQFQHSSKQYVPCKKGGTFRRWFGDNEYIIKWRLSSLFHRPRTTYIDLYYRPAISWSAITSGKFHCRFYEKGFLFDHAAASLFPQNIDFMMSFLAYMNTKVFNYLLEAINPTINSGADVVGRLPIPGSIPVETNDNASKCVDISHKDWDSYETSWGFLENPLIDANRHSGHSGKLSVVYGHLRTTWKHQCETMRKLEVENNRIFIDIYGLQDELSPDVPWDEITLTCNPWYRYKQKKKKKKSELSSDESIFEYSDESVEIKVSSPDPIMKSDFFPLDQKKEDRLLQDTIKELISYAVGCMFGRYSLDVPGLAFAGGEWDASKYATFPADDDNIVPICDDDYFKDDLASRFVSFIETVFGAESLEENLNFIAKALGGRGSSREVIRKYFREDFFADHCKMYQKRPIYWLFDSGKKGGFRALIYLHRYQPDTLARLRTDYVHEQQERYRTAMADLEVRIDKASGGEKIKLEKQMREFREQAEETRLYEEKIHHLADKMISIDLDDGVKHNYAIFQDVLAKIK